MVFDDEDVVRFAADELEPLLLGTLDEGQLIRARCIVHSLILIYNNCMADGQMHEDLFQARKLFMLCI